MKTLLKYVCAMCIVTTDTTEKLINNCLIKNMIKDSKQKTNRVLISKSVALVIVQYASILVMHYTFTICFHWLSSSITDRLEAIMIHENVFSATKELGGVLDNKHFLREYFSSMNT